MEETTNPPTSPEPSPELNAEPIAGAFDPIRSLTRLGLGTATFAIDKLMTNLKVWESDVEARLDQERPDVVVIEDADDELDEDDDEEGGDAPKGLPRDPEQIRLAMIGAIFDAQRRVRQRASGVGSAATHAMRGASMILSIFGVMEAVDTAGRRLTPFLQMSDEQFRRLVDLGREEDRHASMLLHTAFKETSEASIDDIGGQVIGQLADSPEIRDLIRSQSTGMAEDAIGDVRVMAAGADDRVGNVAKSIFRRGGRDGDEPIQSVPIGDTPPPS
jgi:hypothetical protein